MKNEGIVRNIDSLGRVVVPKEFRKILNLNTNDPVEILCVDGAIKIKKFNNVCAFCGSKENLKDIRNIHICEKCRKELKNVLE